MKRTSVTRASITRLSALMLGAAASATAFGSGFALNEQSARTLGQAFSGRASDADNASTLISNPAGMALLKRRELSAGFALIDASSHFSDVVSTANNTTVPGSNDGDMIPLTAIPFGYYVQPIDAHWAAGVGLYVPYGLATEHEDEFQGRYFGTISDIQVLTLQPTVSYRFDNGLALGLGVTFNKFDGTLKKAIYNPLAPTSDIRAGVEGEDTAWGYNIGALYEFNEHTRIGLTYYSKVKYTLDGDTDLRNVPGILGIGSSPSFDATLAIETPDRVDFGLTHELTPQLTLHADITRTNWTTLKEIRVENEGAPASIAESVEPLDWDASMLYSLGLSYTIDSQWRIRGGIGFDEQPMPDATRSVRLPAGDRKLFAFGATWSPSRDLDIDAGYLYIKERTVHIDQHTESLVVNRPIVYQARVESSVNLLAVQANWRF